MVKLAEKMPATSAGKTTDKAARLRWAVLLSALAATLAAIWYPVEEQGQADSIARPAKRPKRTDVSALAQHGELAPMGQGDEAHEDDPFAPRGWTAPPPPVVQQAVVVPIQPAAPLAPPGPPPLPFQFVGRMNDEGQQVVYLSRGDQALVARQGDTLEGTYKVVSIDAQRIEFEHLPTGEKQVMTLTANN
jgi:hypothetical protein